VSCAHELGFCHLCGVDVAAERDALRAQLAAMREALVRAEWAGPRTERLRGDDGYLSLRPEFASTCPVCRMGRDRGHAGDCPLSAALAATAGKEKA
jgi:hypothetical protein